jgi:hypothetical protein
MKLCPSAQPEMDGAVAFGVVGGTAHEPVVSYLPEPIPASAKLLQLSRPVKPTEVFRFAAPCAERDCQHYDIEDTDEIGRCRLAERITADIPPIASEKLPACRIRGSCRWWEEQGRAACSRCPLIVTEHYSASPELRRAAEPHRSRP